MPGLSAIAGGVVEEEEEVVVVVVSRVEEVKEEEARVMRCDVRVDEIHGCID